MRYLCSRLLLGFMVLSVSAACAQDDSKLPEEVYLYDGDAPGSEGRSDEAEQIRPGADRVVTNVHRPSIFPYLPEASKATGMAVIIAPGGGHNSLWSTHEGHAPAKYFAARGIAAFVLEYRLAEEQGSTYTVDEHALGDMQRAIRLVRSRASEWKIDPERVGVMGFSAGGELVAIAGMRFENANEDAKDPVTRLSSRPDFLALIYPGRSHRYEAVANIPPVFIVAGFGDRPDISQGMAEVYLKLRKAKVPTEMHIYSKAGHGFGYRPEREGSVNNWVERFIDWANDMRFISTPASK